MKFGFHSSLCTIPICLSQEEPHVLLVFLDKISICTLIYLFVSSLQGVCALNVMQKSAKRISFFFFCLNMPCFVITTPRKKSIKCSSCYPVVLVFLKVSLWYSYSCSYLLWLKMHCREWWSYFPLVWLCWDSPLCKFPKLAASNTYT